MPEGEYERLVRRDVTDGLREVGFEVDRVALITSVQGEVMSPPAAEHPQMGVAAETYHWIAHAEHTASDSGHPATHQPVEIEGMTIAFPAGSGETEFLRVIDWASVNSRLGFVLETWPLAPPALDPPALDEES